MWQTPLGHRLGPERRWATGGPFQRRDLLTRHTGAEPRQRAQHEWLAWANAVRIERVRPPRSRLRQPAASHDREHRSCRTCMCSTGTFQNPRTISLTVGYGGRFANDLAASISYTHARGDHLNAVHQSQRRGIRQSIRRVRDRRALRHRHPVDGREQRQVALQRCHGGPQARARSAAPVRCELHSLVRQVGRRQRARPVHLAVCEGRFTRQRNTTGATATSDTA